MSKFYYDISDLIDLISSADRERTGKENIFELAELKGRKEAVLELLERITES